MREGRVIKTIKVPNKRRSGDPYKRDVITDIEEIEYLQLLAVATTEKFIFVYDLENEILKITLDIEKGGVHSLCFF